MYLIQDGEDSDYEVDMYGEEDQNPQENGDEVDDLINYKGIYFNDDQGQKFQCPDTGAHFQFEDMCNRIKKIMKERGEEDPFLLADSEQQIVS